MHRKIKARLEDVYGAEVKELVLVFEEDRMTFKIIIDEEEYDYNGTISNFITDAIWFLEFIYG